MKIRTDFVTNSSSSSFVAVLDVILENGKHIRVIDDDNNGGEASGTIVVKNATGSMNVSQIKNVKNLQDTTARYDNVKSRIVRGYLSLKCHTYGESIWEANPENMFAKYTIGNAYKKVKSYLPAKYDKEQIEERISEIKKDIELSRLTSDSIRTLIKYIYTDEIEPDTEIIQTFCEDGTEKIDIKNGNYLFDIEDDWRYTNDIPDQFVSFVENGPNGDFLIESGLLKEYKGKDSIVEVPTGVLSIESDVFRYNTTMMKIELPEGLRSIGEEAFMGVFLDEISLPDSLEEIGEGAFSNCNRMKSIKIPRNVKVIADNAFCDCALSEFIVDEANSHFISVDGVLFSKDMRKLIAYPKAKCGNRYIIPEEICEIGGFAFCANENIEEVVLPAELESIGWAAFSRCDKLQKVDLPNGIKRVDKYAFERTKLRSVIVPGSLSVIESDTFSDNNALQEVIISEGVTSILDRAFSSTGIREIVIPESVSEISRDAFSFCSQLKKVSVSEHLEKPGRYFQGCRITIRK